MHLRKRIAALLRHPTPASIWGATIAGLFVLLLFFVAIAWDFYRGTILINELAARNIATLLEQGIARDIEIYDHSLYAVLEGLGDPEVMNQPPRLRHITLFDRSASARGLGALVSLDENGDITFDSLSLEPRAGNFGDREYFQVHKNANHDIGLYVSKPFRARLQDEIWSISISRRIDLPDGSFGGIVSGTVKLDYLREKFKDVAIGARGTITLFRDDGTMIVRNADTGTDTSIGKDWKSLPLFQHFPEQRRGIYHASNSIDGVSRIYAYEKIGSLPLIVSVGLSMQDVLAPWWSKVLALAAIYVLMAASVIFLVRLFVRELTLRRKAAVVQARLARRDVLTQLGNRREFEETLAREWRRAVRSQNPLSLVLLDIDHFKLYNDAYGHREGDRVLAEVAHTIAESVRRPSDIATRYGGEEMAVILPETEEAGAVALAETVRQKVAALNLVHSGNEYEIVTVSGGVATLVPDDDKTPEALIRLADAALYAAKCGGRNKVVASSASEEPDAAGYSKVA